MLEDEEEGGGNVQGVAVLVKYVKNIKLCEKKPSDHCRYAGMLILLVVKKNNLYLSGGRQRSYQMRITPACQTFNL